MIANKGQGKDQKVNDRGRADNFSISPVLLLSIAPHIVPVSVWCVQEEHAVIFAS